MHRILAIVATVCVCSAAAQDRPTMSSVLDASAESDWRTPDPHNTLYLNLAGGQVVFELAPEFAPAHIENIRKLVGQQYFDGLAIVRSQDNYVVQWGDPNAGTDSARSFANADDSIDPEFDRDANGLSITGIEARDAYADDVGFVAGFPVARDNDTGRAWLVHCYGMLGVGRANSTRSGSGAELYVVTGHSPRHLDRNATLIGRVISGIEHLSTLPRGTGPMGYYAEERDRVPISSIRFGDAMDENDQINIKVLRTDTETFQDLVEARRYRADDWFVEPTDAIELCNVPVPSRTMD
jgi:peptidylprolyl isomerase